MRRKGKLLTLCLTIATVASIIFTTPASANSSCDPAQADPTSRSPDDFDNPRQLMWREIADPGYNITSVGASLEYLTPGGDDWGSAGTSVWIGLLQPTGVNYVQAGYRTWNFPGQGVTRRIFLEYKDGSNDFVRYEWTPPAVDTSHDFQLQFLTNTTVKFFYDSVQYGPTLPAMGWLPTRSVVGGETHSRGWQLYGGTWDYEDIDSMRYVLNHGPTYINYGGTPDTYPSVTNDWSSQFTIWTYGPNQQAYNGSSQIDMFDKDCH